MTVAAITDNYAGEPLDKVENFNGKQVVYIGWDHHLMFCAPFAFPLPPEMPFRALIDEVIPGAFGRHRDFSEVKWNEVIWHLNGEPFEPQPEDSLIDQGIDHKSIIRFATPGLNGIKGSGT